MISSAVEFIITLFIKKYLPLPNILASQALGFAPQTMLGFNLNFASLSEQIIIVSERITKQVLFEVPTGTKFTCLARALQMINERRYSLRVSLRNFLVDTRKLQ